MPLLPTFRLRLAQPLAEALRSSVVVVLTDASEALQRETEDARWAVAHLARVPARLALLADDGTPADGAEANVLVVTCSSSGAAFEVPRAIVVRIAVVVRDAAEIEDGASRLAVVRT